MPVNPGKPGTVRIRGVTRAQCKQVNARMASFLAYNTKLAAQVPPITFLSPLNLASVQACQTAMQNLLDQKNT